MEENIEQELPNDDNQDVNQDASQPADEKELEKAEKREKERKKILNDAVSGRIEDDRSRVAFILNNSVESRNSDSELVWLYWETFDKELFNGISITREVYKKITPPASIIRLRAKIQNEYKLFQANDKVKKFRGVLEEEKRQQAIEDKPIHYPFYNVFIDETGKNQPFLSIGSLWLNDAKEKALSFFKLKEWKEQRNIDFEFHFNEVKGHRLDQYKAFFKEFVTLHPSAGFKVIVINRSGLSNSAITDLTFHLINEGIKHEHESGRAPLPRMLQVFIDNEEEGSDQLKLVNVKERLISQNIDGLQIGPLEAVDSVGNVYLQVVDLFIASVNRKLHTPDGTGHKDDLANYVLDLLNFDISDVSRERIDVDKSFVFNLAYQKS